MKNPPRIRDHREPGHYWADNEVVDNYLPVIGAYGFAVYMLLTRFANHKTGQCDPSLKTIATTLGISPPTAKKALDTLEAAGLITITYRPRASSNRKVNETNIYTLLAVEKEQRGTQGDWVPKEIGYGVPNDVDKGTQGDWVGVPKEVGTNNKEEESKKREGATPAPALDIYAQLTGIRPAQYAATMIAEQVTDTNRWERTIKDWLASGFKPANVKGMLDWYHGKGRHQNNGATNRAPADLPLTHASPQPTPEERAAAAERRRAILDERKAR